jgi:thioredoxin 1
MSINITKENFEEKIVKGKDILVVDFWATWCGPCRMIGPIIEKLHEEYKDSETVGVYKVNTDEEQDITIKFGIRSIPTILFFKKGELVDTFIGTRSEQDIVNKINELR